MPCKAVKAIEKHVREQYLGKKVPKQYQKKYGKRYDESEVEEIAYAIAKSKGIKV
jgi:hypothetical protein